MSTVASFKGICVECTEDIIKGQLIENTGDGWKHVICDPDDVVNHEAKPRPTCPQCWIELPASLVCPECS